MDNKKSGAMSEIINKIQDNNSPTKSIVKEAKKQEIKAKYYYDVKIECMLPATLTYRVLAEDAQQAAQLIKHMSPNGVKHRLIGRKDIRISVYEAGTVMLKWVKSLIG